MYKTIFWNEGYAMVHIPLSYTVRGMTFKLTEIGKHENTYINEYGSGQTHPHDIQYYHCVPVAWSTIHYNEPVDYSGLYR